ncbi:MAG TPA: hypothetical protein VFZ97_04740 [Acidimicrobiales bacterium]
MAMSTASVRHRLIGKDSVGTWVDRELLIRIGLGTLIAAVLDAGFAFVTYVLIAHRYNFETLLQYIATGVDHHAFRSGWTGVGTAALGFVIHLGLSLGFAVAYAVGLRNAQRSTAGIAALGIIYGAVIWVIMAGAVLPGLGVMHEPAGGRYWWAFLVDHAILVGLPIAVIGSFRSNFNKDHQR